MSECCCVENECCGGTNESMSECCCGGANADCGCDSGIGTLSDKITILDILGTCKARCGIGRMNYNVAPGLYKIGEPDENSHVFVTGNYKMSVDALRKGLKGVHAWILVLDTKGINVWCAAGKGTFGSDELIHRIEETNLSSYVEHKSIILPQLGAVGVAAHDVTNATGFQVIYGPVRAKDISAFLKRDLTADAEMRTVQFNAADRAVLIPMEIVGAAKPTVIALGIVSIANALGLLKTDSKDAKAYVGAVVAGSAVVPALLPAIPGRALSLKGGLLGLLWAMWMGKDVIRPDRSIALPTKKSKDKRKMKIKSKREHAAGNLLILPAISAFFALKFTGCTPYTSMSGVKKETKLAMPVMAAAMAGGIALVAKSSHNDRLKIKKVSNREIKHVIKGNKEGRRAKTGLKEKTRDI